jgi:hypothetical protein
MDQEEPHPQKTINNLQDVSIIKSGEIDNVKIYISDCIVSLLHPIKSDKTYIISAFLDNVIYVNTDVAKLINDIKYSDGTFNKVSGKPENIDLIKALIDKVITLLSTAEVYQNSEWCDNIEHDRVQCATDFINIISDSNDKNKKTLQNRREKIKGIFSGFTPYLSSFKPIVQPAVLEEKPNIPAEAPNTAVEPPKIDQGIQPANIPVQPIINQVQQKDAPVDNQVKEKDEQIDNQVQQKDAPVDNQVKEKDEQIDNQVKEKDEQVDNQAQQKDAQVDNQAHKNHKEIFKANVQPNSFFTQFMLKLFQFFKFKWLFPMYLLLLLYSLIYVSTNPLFHREVITSKNIEQLIGKNGGNISHGLIELAKNANVNSLIRNVTDKFKRLQPNNQLLLTNGVDWNNMQGDYLGDDINLIKNLDGQRINDIAIQPFKPLEQYPNFIVKIPPSLWEVIKRARKNQLYIGPPANNQLLDNNNKALVPYNPSANNPVIYKPLKRDPPIGSLINQNNVQPNNVQPNNVQPNNVQPPNDQQNNVQQALQPPNGQQNNGQPNNNLPAIAPLALARRGDNDDQPENNQLALINQPENNQMVIYDPSQQDITEWVTPDLISIDNSKPVLPDTTFIKDISDDISEDIEDGSFRIPADPNNILIDITFEITGDAVKLVNITYGETLQINLLLFNKQTPINEINFVEIVNNIYLEHNKAKTLVTDFINKTPPSYKVINKQLITGQHTYTFELVNRDRDIFLIGYNHSRITPKMFYNFSNPNKTERLNRNIQVERLGGVKKRRTPKIRAKNSKDRALNKNKTRKIRSYSNGTTK